jgi:ribosome recycling factor
MGTFQSDLEAIIAHTAQELFGIRGGRAVPALVENISVECYGSTMPLKHVASVTIPEPRTIAVTPWDKTIIAQLTRALERADLGAMPTVHGETIHVTLPPLTTERREQLRKLVGTVVEEGRIAIRRLRDAALQELKRKQEEGAISEDDFFREKDRIEEEIREAKRRLEDLREKKEKEIETV